MEMEMGDRLARLLPNIGHHTVAVQAQLLGHFGDDCENMGHYGGVVLCHLGHRSDMGLGDNQKVGGRLGIDVMEGKEYGYDKVPKRTSLLRGQS